MTTRPRMIERWFPCEEVSNNSSQGWGSGNSEANLFTWFARRPLAQAKAAVITSLLPWPDSPPEQRRLQELVRKAFPSHVDEGGRDAMHDELVAELAKHYPDGALMLDPFSGRAMIPVEAARLCQKAIGIDYSPVATLAGKLLADYPLRDWDEEPEVPFKRGDSNSGQLGISDEGEPRLLRDVRTVLEVIGERYEQAMDHYYPKVDGKRPWGYLWAVTLPCKECRRRFPLTGSLTLRHPLATKNDPGQSYKIVTDSATGDFEVVVHTGPPQGQPTVRSVEGKRGKSAVCPFSGCEHVHGIDVHTRMMNEDLAEDRLLAVADLDDTVGKLFREPVSAEFDAIEAASKALTNEPDFPLGIPAVPDEKIPAGNNDTVRPSKYGYRAYGELCNDRQTLGFIRLARIISDLAAEMLEADLSETYVTALTSYGASNLVRRLKRSTRGAALLPMLYPTSNRVATNNIFQNEASIAFNYDYFETGGGIGPGTWVSVSSDTNATLAKQFERRGGLAARIERGSALALPLRDGSVDAVVTDPPYDAMIDYTDASDLFYVWLKRAFSTVDRSFGMSAHPTGVQEKAEEIIVKRGGTSSNDHRTKDFYNAKLTEALAEASRVTSPDGVVTFVFGHNSPDVWRRLLQTITDAGLILTGTWPALTEKGGGAGSANIVTTMTLACRVAPANRQDGRANEVAAAIREEVKKRIPLWEQAGLALTDQQMAAYGPAMEIVGQFDRVLNNKAEPEELEKFLLIARQAVEEAADIRIDGLPLGTFDARTRFALSWARQHRREVSDAAQERWQRLTAQAVSGSELNLDGLVKKVTGGVRLAYGDETETEVDRDTPIVDVAFALARAGKSLTATAEILQASGRADDQFLWSAIIELGRQLGEADRDGETFTWLTRNRKEASNAAANVETLREAERQAQEEADKQMTIFE